jgi:hypothetical protein
MQPVPISEIPASLLVERDIDAARSPVAGRDVRGNGPDPAAMPAHVPPSSVLNAEEGNVPRHTDQSIFHILAPIVETLALKCDGDVSERTVRKAVLRILDALDRQITLSKYQKQFQQQGFI